jgi:hypothetical protein
LLATHAALLQPTYRPSPSVVPAAEARSPVWWIVVSPDGEGVGVAAVHADGVVAGLVDLVVLEA